MNEGIIYIIIFFIISLLLNFIMLLIYSGFKQESLYHQIIADTWYHNYPILDISTVYENENYERIKLMSFENMDTFCDCTHVGNDGHSNKGICNHVDILNGCNQYEQGKIASKFFNKTLYVSYYKVDYWTLFDRIENDENGLHRRCKKIEKGKYKICGHLDIFGNILCVFQEEECPINEITFNFNEDETIESINRKGNDNLNKPIINKIFASEIEDMTIFEINQILTKKNITYPNKEKREEEKFFTLSYFYNESYYSHNKYFTTKIKFFSENKLTNKPFPDWFNDYRYSYMYFYHLVYLGNSFEYPIKKIHITLFNKPSRLAIRSLIFIFRVYFIIMLILNNSTRFEDFIKKNINLLFILNLILIVCGYLILIILNTLLIQGKYFISQNLYKYLKIKFGEKTADDFGKGKTVYSFDIINSIFDFTIFILCSYFIISIFFENREKKNDEDSKLINNNE